MYAAQTFSQAPDNRRIQMGWLRTHTYGGAIPDQMYSQGFTLPQELTLKETDKGLRMMYQPVKEVEKLRDKKLTDDPTELSLAEGKYTEVIIEFEKSSWHSLTINGIKAGFHGKKARIFTDQNMNEIYMDDGIEYRARSRQPADLNSTTTSVDAKSKIKSLTIYTLKSIWN